MADTPHGGIFGDLMLYWVADNHEWCAAYMPLEIYGYGDTQEAALRHLRAALLLRKGELTGCLQSHGPGAQGTLVDLATYRRHKSKDAIQRPQPNG